MSDINNVVSSVAKVVGGCLPGKHFSGAPLPTLPLPPTVILPVVVAGATVYAARSLVRRLFD
ncbi:hypothetical protein [Methylomonas sp. DH-1]|uniref:hypothetical protein n=1 Tax=Methylomonas sp. (strain DH-1) TaxID=1727196 RepID=UPI000A7B1E8C|nr:hypothetical protein [Methylomonas sp. DH-1]